ncbi:hypothetical protein D3C78_235020 [compost metagenome]
MTTKTVYQTDRHGIYVGTTQADQSPLEENVWLIPAGCVETPPPEIPAGKAAYWASGRWQLVENLEGFTAYNTDNREPLLLQRLESLPPGYTLQPPGQHQVWRDGQWVDDIPAVLASQYQDKYQAIDAACTAAITAGFMSAALGTPHSYSSDLEDQLNLTGAVLRGLDMPYACRDEQGAKAFRLHTAAQLRQVGDDFTLYKLQLLQHANELRQQLDQALSAGDIEAIEQISWGPLP